MDTHRFIGTRYLSFAIAALLLTAGCASLHPKPPQKALTERVQRLWEAKVAKDWTTVYRMTDAKYRKTVSLAKYLDKGKTIPTSFSIRRIEMAEDRQSALVVTVFEGILMGQLRKVSVGERWVYEDGQWWLKLSDPVNIFEQPAKQ